jgi:uncharacterized protein YcbX
MLQLSGLTTYPIKSCAGSALAGAALDRFGLSGDRRWLVVDAGNRFLSQREHALMALLQPEQSNEGLLLRFREHVLAVTTPVSAAKTRLVSIWEDTVPALDAGDEAADWLSERLGQACRLVFMPDDCQRLVDGRYASAGETVSFADAFPLLLISQASLDDLNSRLSRPVPMDRFRPNLVVQGCEAYAEDHWRRIRIGSVEFTVAKPCSRCVVPSIDQATAEKDSEILRVLASYRRGQDRQTYFGQNLLYQVTGRLELGATVEVLEQSAG